MNEIINKFVLAVDKFKPKIYLRQLAALCKTGLTYSACGIFT